MKSSEQEGVKYLEKKDSHIAFMLFFGSRGISRTLVPWIIFSKLVVVTVLPVMRCTW